MNQVTFRREKRVFGTYLGGIIITPRNSHIPPNLYTSHTLRMSSQGMQTSPPLDIPYAESVVARAGDGDRSVGKDFDTADGGGMAGEGVDALSIKRVFGFVSISMWEDAGGRERKRTQFRHPIL